MPPYIVFTAFAYSIFSLFLPQLTIDRKLSSFGEKHFPFRNWVKRSRRHCVAPLMEKMKVVAGFLRHFFSRWSLWKWRKKTIPCSWRIFSLLVSFASRFCVFVLFFSSEEVPAAAASCWYTATAIASVKPSSIEKRFFMSFRCLYGPKEKRPHWPMLLNKHVYIQTLKNWRRQTSHLCVSFVCASHDNSPLPSFPRSFLPQKHAKNQLSSNS